MLSRANPCSLLSRTLRFRPPSKSSWIGPKRWCNSLEQKEEIVENVRLAIQQRMLLIKATMIKRRKIVFRIPGFISRAREPIVITYNYSNLAGHGSFILLVLCYAESEFLSLRLYALSGITLTILFQYYREKPLWLPIYWNTMFLFVNAFMIGKLIRDDLAAENMTTEEKLLYQSIFEKKGMCKADFKKLISKATRIVIPAHTVLLKENVYNTRVYLVQSGNISVRKGGSEVGIIRENMFVGEMSFLSWDSKQTENELAQRRQAASTSFFSHFLTGSEKTSTATEKQIEEELGTGGDAGESAPHPPSVASAEEESSSPSLANVMWDYAWQVTTSFLFPDSSASSDPASSSDDVVETASSASPAMETTNDDSEGQNAHATVVALTDCVLYYWPFQEMRKLKEAHPQMNGILERCISDDLNRKMFTTWDKEMRERYRQLVLGATSDGHVCSEVKEMLARCRERLKISDEEHVEVLRDVGWTLDEYTTGFKGATSQAVIDHYGELLRSEISQRGGVTPLGRYRLRQYRAKHNLSAAVHLSVLQDCGWTLDDYEAGRQGAEGELVEAVEAVEAVPSRGEGDPSPPVRAPVLNWLYTTVSSAMARPASLGSPSVLPVSNTSPSAPSSPRLARSIEAIINTEPEV